MSERIVGLAAIATLSLSAVVAQPVPPDAAQPVPGAEGGNARDLGVWLSYGASNNVAETSIPIRGSYYDVGVQFDVDRQAARSSLGLATNLEFRNYSVDTLEDEPIGTVDLLAVLTPVPDRFSWLFQDDYGTVATDALRPDTPNNRETFNVFRTGPQLTLPLGRRTILDLRGTYGERHYETSDRLDSTDVNSQVGVLRQPDATTRYGLIGRQSEIEFDVDLPGYAIDALLLQYTKVLASGNVLVELGENTLDVSDEEQDGPLARLRWDRDIATRSRITIAGAREFTDSGTLLALGVGRINSEDVPAVLLDPNPLELERVSILYGIALGRSDVSIQLASTTEIYESNPSFDNDGVEIQLTLRRELTALLQMQVNVGVLERDFTTREQRDRDDVLALTITRNMGRDFQLSGRIERRERLGTGAFDRNVVEVQLTYRPGAR